MDYITPPFFVFSRGEGREDTERGLEGDPLGVGGLTIFL